MKKRKSWDEFSEDVKSLISGIAKFDPEVIVPCMRGALVPATIIAEELKIYDILPIDVERINRDRNLSLFYMPTIPLRGKKVLILEDDLYTGEGVIKVKEFLESQGAIVKVAAIYATLEAKHHADFYFSSHIKEDMPDYPWKPTRNDDRIRSKNVENNSLFNKPSSLL
jgi:hypoxanthine phosphoribosyltransferase